MKQLFLTVRSWKLEVIVFLSGAVVMVFEIVGSRLLAPYLGTSIITWTSLIGVILASLSVGYYVGGRVADRRQSIYWLALTLLLAALSVAFALLVQKNLLTILAAAGWSLEIKSLAAALVLFAPTSFCLGGILPQAVKLRLHQLDKSGAVVGGLYALSTVGSLFGTFGAGFYLIPALGTIKIFILLAAILLVLAWLATVGEGGGRSFVWLVVGGILFVGLSALAGRSDGTTIDTDTKYSRVFIADGWDGRNKEPTRFMLINGGNSSAMYLNDDELVFPYTRFYRLAEHFNPGLRKAVMLGGAGYSYPKDFLAKLPWAELTVVEIDEGVTALARRYFQLPDDPRLLIRHQDARLFLNQSQERYDAILGDAFSALYSLPYQLATREAVQREYDLLNDDGVVLVNLISALQGPKSEFLRAEYATYQSVFPQVYLLPVNDPSNGEAVQNIMLVALKSKSAPQWTSVNQEWDGYLKQRWLWPVEPARILTDDWAPVDYYINKML